MASRPDPASHKRFRWLKRPRGFARDDGAMAAVEFGLLALPLFAIIFAALQWAIVLMAEQELNSAADQAGRLVMTGQVSSTSGQTGYLTQTQFQKKVCGYLVALFNCANLMINMQTANSFSGANTSTPSFTTIQKDSWSYQTGSHNNGSTSVIVLQVMYEWPIFGNLLGFNLTNLPNSKRLLMATSVFMNEPLQ
jgi:Flp pilus assembly protein TadG